MSGPVTAAAARSVSERLSVSCSGWLEMIICSERLGVWLVVWVHIRQAWAAIRERFLLRSKLLKLARFAFSAPGTVACLG